MNLRHSGLGDGGEPRKKRGKGEFVEMKTQRIKPTHSGGGVRVRLEVQLNYHCGPEKAG